jgi:signal transduction histidine kinase
VRELELGTETVLAFAFGLALFAVVAVSVAVADSSLLAMALGAAYIAAVAAIVQRWGVAYGVPAAIAALIAYDWFEFPPTHPKAIPDLASLANLVVYLFLAVVVGGLLAGTRRRAEATETARRELANEQASLRRVATLVARDVPPDDMFAAIAREAGLLLGADAACISRGEDHETVVVASWSRDGGGLPAAERVPAAVGAPVVVDNERWGELTIRARNGALGPDAESRVAAFTELVATAIANIEARSDLAASRARVVAAADDERRRVVRDLHDGAQQRLVHTIVTLRMAERALRQHQEAAPALVTEALGQAESALVELRELARGILPSVLTWGGLTAGVEALASRMPVPVDVDVAVDRFAPAVEASAYFVVAEALTNVAKHAHARRAAVTAAVANGQLRIAVEDDGVGMADPNGHGLLGLADRLASLDGELRVVSAPSQGTTLIATVPLPD